MEHRTGKYSKYAHLPSTSESVAYIKSLEKKSVATLLSEADRDGRLLIQPRCGVCDFDGMKNLLQELETGARPDILSLTIDSYTRLCRFDDAERIMSQKDQKLNGFPLVNHGYEIGRTLNESCTAPIEIRHGTPDARLLFEVAIASGITSFEGGGICYNLPYCRDISIEETIRNWQQVDAYAGELYKSGIVVDRELFGTLTAVMIPPSMSLAMTLLEAILAANEGVKCLSIAYPQSGNLVQDVAALKAIRNIFPKYLPKDVRVYPVLHGFMGAFPKNRQDAEALITFGAMTAKLGGATKVINKTYQEAHGIPTGQANCEGILASKIAASPILANTSLLNSERVQEEIHWIETEVSEIVDPILQGPSLVRSIVDGFATGRLDISYSASKFAHSNITPLRDVTGAIRYFDAGNLPFSHKTISRHKKQLEGVTRTTDFDLFVKACEDISYFESTDKKRKPTCVN